MNSKSKSNASATTSVTASASSPALIGAGSARVVRFADFATAPDAAGAAGRGAADAGGKFVDVAGAAAGGIARRTVLQTAELRVVWFGFAAGQELGAHSSPNRALVQVVEGACEFFLNGSWQRLEAGALLHLPPRHVHAARASFGGFAMLLTLGLGANDAGGVKAGGK